MLAPMTQTDLERLIQNDRWMMRVLQAAEEIGLPDWWIGAGFLRNAVWDHLSGRPPLHDADVDLVYFDRNNRTPECDWEFDDIVRKRFPFAMWEVRNQARMHVVDGSDPYSSTAEGISHWVETATCVAVRLSQGRLSFLFCYGTQDLFNMVARPIPALRSAAGQKLFESRIQKKKWTERWPSLKIVQ